MERGRALVRASWQEDVAFDLSAHLHSLSMETARTRDGLAALLSDLISAPLPRGRSLWSIHTVEDVDGAGIIIFRVHHCVADGVALVRLLRSICDGASTNPRTVGRASGSRAGKSQRVRHIVERTALLGKLAILRDDASSPPKEHLGQRKAVAWSRPLNLLDVERLASQPDGPVNDVLQDGARVHA